MKLANLCPIIQKDNGFYITDLKDQSEMFFQDSDDFYERPFAPYLMEREAFWVETKGTHLNVIIK